MLRMLLMLGMLCMLIRGVRSIYSIRSIHSIRRFHSICNIHSCRAVSCQMKANSYLSDSQRAPAGSPSGNDKLSDLTSAAAKIDVENRRIIAWQKKIEKSSQDGYRRAKRVG